MVIRSKHVQAGCGSWHWPLTTCTTLREPTLIHRASAASPARDPAFDLILCSRVGSEGNRSGRVACGFSVTHVDRNPIETRMAVRGGARHLSVQGNGHDGSCVSATHGRWSQV